jgi:hypothetical protein
MPARKPLLGTHVDYHGTLDAINGLVPRDDQVLTAAELVDLAQTVTAHADDIDAQQALIAAVPALDDASAAADRVWSAQRIIAYLAAQVTTLQNEIDALELILVADDADFDTAQERLNELKRLAGLIGSLGIEQIDGLQDALDAEIPQSQVTGLVGGLSAIQGEIDALLSTVGTINTVLTSQDIGVAPVYANDAEAESAGLLQGRVYVTPAGLVMRKQENTPTITHVILYGQSLSLGTATDGTDAIISSPNSDHRMFNGGVRAHYDYPSLANPNTAINPDQIASFVTLAEQASIYEPQMKETFASGIALRSTKQLLLSCTGRGAYTVSKLSRLASGVFADANHFKNTYATVLAGSEIAKEQGIVYKLGPMLFKQGEADASVNTTKAQWKSGVQTLYEDFKSHLKHAAHVDTTDFIMLIDQQAYQLNDKGYGEISVAAIELHRDGIGVVCVGPTYTGQFATDTEVHMSSVGYRNYGEKLGLVIDAINSGNEWNPCHITAVSRSGTTITVEIHVPVAPLAKDTSLVESVSNDGFAYSGAGITSVTITNTGAADGTAIVEIEIDADAGGVLRYAYENGTNARSGSISGARGNIRDSDPAVTQYDGTPLHNWLCNDEWSVS